MLKQDEDWFEDTIANTIIISRSGIKKLVSVIILSNVFSFTIGVFMGWVIRMWIS